MDNDQEVHLPLIQQRDLVQVSEEHLRWRLVEYFRMFNSYPF